jgi:hypothetical protein
MALPKLFILEFNALSLKLQDYLARYQSIHPDCLQNGK